VHYLLIYELVDDYMDRRAAFRDEHIQLAQEACRCGELILAGAIEEPADKALILFSGDSPAAAEAFAAADPYVRNGLVTGWRVRPWRTVVGDLAAFPLPDSGDR